ncbi:MAG: hypothetical protein QM820_21785 [Minicystis sp.]
MATEQTAVHPAGTASGPLTVRSNPPYQRRRDLKNPSDLVDRLLRISFGN